MKKKISGIKEGNMRTNVKNNSAATRPKQKPKGIKISGLKINKSFDVMEIKDAGGMKDFVKVFKHEVDKVSDEDFVRICKILIKGG